MPTIPEVAPAPIENPQSNDKVALGKLLYFDPRLSLTKTVSCNSCHNVVGTDATGADNRPFSLGVGARLGERNAPTVWNSGLREFLFWDGRAKSLEEQAKGPLINPKEMAMPSLKEVERVVESIPEYKKKIMNVFKVQHVGIDQIVMAIASYERTLMTPNSKFDRFQKGEINALAEKEKQGWEKFNSIGCIACHGAPTFSNKDYFVNFPQRNTKDLNFVLDLTRDKGRGAFTKIAAENNRWRVPSLRNVEITGPYFHNGSVRTLEEAVRVMGKAQIGIDLADEDVNLIVGFLKTLTGIRKKETFPKLP